MRTLGQGYIEGTVAILIWDIKEIAGNLAPALRLQLPTDFGLGLITLDQPVNELLQVNDLGCRAEGMAPVVQGRRGFVRDRELVMDVNNFLRHPHIISNAAASSGNDASHNT